MKEKTKWERRCECVDTAEGWPEFWLACQRFFGYHNFTREEIMGIMKHIDATYFMAFAPKKRFE